MMQNQPPVLTYTRNCEDLRKLADKNRVLGIILHRPHPRKENIMARKILAGTLIGLSSLLLLLSLVGIVLTWVYNEPLTKEATARLSEVDAQLAQIQTDLRGAKSEVERALRIIQSAEDALASLTRQTTDAKQLLEQVNKTLDDDLIPNLESTRNRLTEARKILDDLRNTLNTLNSLPFVNLNAPGDELLAGIITGVDSLDLELENVQDLAKQASIFINDTSYFLGGDFLETKQNLQNLLQVLEGYDEQLTGWRAQVDMLIASAPRWIDNASLSLTIGLFWFAFSQGGLVLHGLSLWYGEDPFAVLKKAFRKPSEDEPVSV
jgi:F0F1-type ATP synthase membrane subunit b/b'